MLHRPDEAQYDVFLQARAQAAHDEVPKPRAHAHGLPVPHVRAAPRVRLAMQQARGELVLEQHRQGAQDARVRRRELAALWRCRSDAGDGAAHVLAADDEKRFLDVVDLDWARRDAAAVH